jgi:hypothetical protein
MPRRQLAYGGKISFMPPHFVRSRTTISIDL